MAAAVPAVFTTLLQPATCKLPHAAYQCHGSAAHCVVCSRAACTVERHGPMHMQETAAVERRRLQQEKQRQGRTGDTEATSKAAAEQQPGHADADRGEPSPDKEQEGEAVVSWHELVQLAAQQNQPWHCLQDVSLYHSVRASSSAGKPDSPALSAPCLVQLAAAAFSFGAVQAARQQCSSYAFRRAAGSSSSQGRCPVQDARQQCAFHAWHGAAATSRQPWCHLHTAR